MRGLGDYFTLFSTVIQPLIPSCDRTLVPSFIDIHLTIYSFDY